MPRKPSPSKKRRRSSGENMAKRTKNEVIRGIQSTLEGYRRFDYDYIPYGTRYIMPDKGYHYRQPWYERVVTGFWRTMMGIFGPPAIRILYGAKTVGREHVRALKGRGAIAVSNHFNYLDTLFVRDALGHFRSFHTMAPWNNKRGLGGHIIRHGGMWPFSNNLAATKNLLREMDRRLKQGKIVNFYAEQALWTNYQKPRPMKEGALYYAVKFHVPVLPVFCTFDRDKRGHLRKLRIHILPAIEPDETLPPKERAKKLKEEAEAAWKACYEAAYGVPLEYLPDRRRSSHGV